LGAKKGRRRGEKRVGKYTPLSSKTFANEGELILWCI